MAHGTYDFPKVASKIWLFRLAGALTTVYIVLQLLVFHLHLEALQSEVKGLWFAVLLSYAVIKEGFRWFNLLDPQAKRRGEWYATLIVGIYIWMLVFNIAQRWIWGLPYTPLPNGYTESMREALAILSVSYVSYAAKKRMDATAKKREQERDSAEKTPPSPVE